ncbi:restriction endonuclease [Paenibacillus polymyxa]|uniref:restriction endonuclease n=1 Tax=Paenibacillus polymyxa TaxID=1406 RepID=UPI002ED3DA77|nr:restriction endonuclease [Paenibacillus polymyxa]
MTRAAGDFGADLILLEGERRIVVQANCYSKNVDLKAVQEVRSARAHYRANGALVVTNSNFTSQAYELAKSNSVRLISRNEFGRDASTNERKMLSSKKTSA